MGPMGPQGPQEGTGGTPRGTGTPPEARGAPQRHGGIFGKSHFLASGRPPANPAKTLSKQPPQPLGPISIAPGCFSGPGGYQKSLQSLHGDHFGSQDRPGPSQTFVCVFLLGGIAARALVLGTCKGIAANTSFRIWPDMSWHTLGATISASSPTRHRFGNCSEYNIQENPLKGRRESPTPI